MSSLPARLALAFFSGGFVERWRPTSVGKTDCHCECECTAAPSVGGLPLLLLGLILGALASRLVHRLHWVVRRFRRAWQESVPEGRSSCAAEDLSVPGVTERAQQHVARRPALADVCPLR